MTVDSITLIIHRQYALLFIRHIGNILDLAFVKVLIFLFYLLGKTINKKVSKKLKYYKINIRVYR